MLILHATPGLAYSAPIGSRSVIWFRTASHVLLMQACRRQRGQAQIQGPCHVTTPGAGGESSLEWAKHSSLRMERLSDAFREQHQSCSTFRCDPAADGEMRFGHLLPLPSATLAPYQVPSPA